MAAVICKVRMNERLVGAQTLSLNVNLGRSGGGFS